MSNPLAELKEWVAAKIDRAKLEARIAALREVAAMLNARAAELEKELG